MALVLPSPPMTINLSQGPDDSVGSLSPQANYHKFSFMAIILVNLALVWSPT